MDEQNQPVVEIVDDSSSVQRSLGNLLESGGFTGRGIRLGEGAELQPTRDDRCLVFDLRMSGMCGLDLLHQRAAGPEIPVMTLTAQGDGGTRRRCLKAGA